MDGDIDVQQNQEIEIDSLRYIYMADQFLVSKDADSGCEGKFSAYPTLPSSFQLYAKTAGDGTSEKSREGKKYKLYTVNHLPPIILEFILPEGYPSFQAPIYTLSCQWLPQQMLTKLSVRLDKMWEEVCGSVILFNWFYFLENDSLKYLQIKTPLELSTFVPFPGSSTVSGKNKNILGAHFGDGEKERKMNTSTTDVNNDNKPTQAEVNSVLNTKNETNSSTKECLCSDPDQRSECSASKDEHHCRTVKEWNSSVRRLLCTILEFNQNEEQKTFNYSFVLCEVCFSEQIGSKCMRFRDCHHAFCNDCLCQYFTVKINEGSVNTLNCPAQDCSSQALPKQVEELVEKELYVRYEKLLLQITLETMNDVVYCPRRTCQRPVIKDVDNLGRCTRCYHSFCILCTQTYHGSSPCFINSEELQKVHKQYCHGDKETKLFLEKRYGKKLLHQIMEEASTAKWLEDNAKMCPSCGTHIQKTDGCNKMVCSKCNAYFCWLCNAKLSSKDPYQHFSDKKSRCFEKLFEGVIGAVDWVDWDDEEFLEGDEDEFIYF